jgi:hypothetical protein
MLIPRGDGLRWVCKGTACALGAMNYLTREQIDALERMRGNPSYDENDFGD